MEHKKEKKDTTKNWKKSSWKGWKRIEIVEVVLVQCNLVDNQYQQRFEVFYTFTPNKSYAYFLNVEPSNLMFLKTYNTEYDEIIVTVMDANSRPLEKKDKFNLTLLNNKQKCDDIL